MTEKVKMTEQQARKIYFFGTRADCEQEFINDLKIQGYILPDPVEEAEEMYKNKNSGIHVYSWEEIADKLYNTVQLMKPYYEKYKGEKL